MLHSKNITIHDIEQGSEEWLNTRRVLATASNAIHVLNGGIQKAIDQNKKTFRGSFWTKRGHKLEAQAIALYCKATGSSSQSVGFVTNSTCGHTGYSPDGVTETKPLEVKCFKKDKHLSIKELLDIPAAVYAQCQFGLMIIEADEIDLILFHPPRDGVEPKDALKIFTIKRDKELIQRFKGEIEKYERSKDS